MCKPQRQAYHPKGLLPQNPIPKSPSSERLSLQRPVIPKACHAKDLSPQRPVTSKVFHSKGQTPKGLSPQRPFTRKDTWVAYVYTVKILGKAATLLFMHEQPCGTVSEVGQLPHVFQDIMPATKQKRCSFNCTIDESSEIIRNVECVFCDISIQSNSQFQFGIENASQECRYTLLR